jgi:hypothetical protein
MLKKIGGLGLAVVLAVLPLFAFIWLMLSDSEVGMAKSIGTLDSGLATADFTSVPPSAVDEAVALATELVGNSQQKLQEIVDQLLATYVEARDRDVVVVFNSGGWGWNITQATSGWGTILSGIKSQLESEGHKTLLLNYRRTGSGIRGILREFLEAATSYPNKARELAARVKFLTDNFPDLRVIIAGESTGTVISDITMNLLKDDTRVYSIQTGTPFWHKPSPLDRTLLMNTNGATVDTFSYGDIPAMVWATVKSWFGISSPNDKPGNILFWLRAPGHDYSWQYPGVYNEIVKFINSNFGAEN